MDIHHRLDPAVTAQPAGEQDAELDQGEPDADQGPPGRADHHLYPIPHPERLSHVSTIGPDLAGTDPGRTPGAGPAAA